MKSQYVVATVVGIGGAVALYYFLRRKSVRSRPPAAFLKPEPPQVQSETALKVEALQAQLALGAAPDAKVVAELAALLGTLSEEDLNDAKMNAEYVSFNVSEWIFYHTLRTKKSVTWNPTTGLMDEALSPRERDLGQRIATTMRQAYWDRHRADLEAQPPNFSNVLLRLGELQARVNEYQKSKKTALFDIDIVKQVVNEGHFDRPFFHALLRAVINALYDLESPASHEETFTHLTTTVLNTQVTSRTEFNREIVESLKYLFTRLDVLEAEIANFKSTQVSLDARRKKERELFHRLIENEVISVENLRSALRLMPSSGTPSYASTNSGIVNLFKKLFVTAITTDAGMKELPESLVPDLPALAALRARGENIVVLACFVVGFASQLPAVLGDTGARFIQQPVDALKRTVDGIAQLIQEKRTVAEMTDELLARVIGFSGVAVSESHVEEITKGIAQCCDASSPVRQLYAKRVAGLIETGVNDASSTVATNALGSKPWFLSECAKQTSVLIADSVDLIAQHLHVYLPVYRDIATSAL